jgi:GNAT superfamily N-acetyltransferase
MADMNLTGPSPIVVQDIRRLEELTLNTSPCLNQQLYDGWVLRASGTDTRRANSVTAIYASLLPLHEKILACEAWYRLLGQAAIFRLTDALSPEGLDGMLAQRGYSREVETFVMTADLFSLPAPEGGAPNGFRVVERSAAQGSADLHRLKQTQAPLVERDSKRQSLWKGEQAFLAIEQGGDIQCCGMARRDGDHVGIFSMYTAEEQRGKGFATRLVGRLVEWGKARGAHTAFLQVHVSNQPAIRVYGKFGFKPRYRYWHRIQPAETG